MFLCFCVSVCLCVCAAGSKLGLSDVQAELDRISNRDSDLDLPNANDSGASDGQDT